MDKKWTWARLIYSLPLGLTGIIYLMYPQESVETLTSFIPGGISLIYVAGFFWIVFSLAISMNFYVKWASLGVILLISCYLIMVHIPAAYSGEHLPIVMFELLRDLSLMGASILIYLREPKQIRQEYPRKTSTSII